jgi:predicted O-methyltransferase YrrM
LGDAHEIVPALEGPFDFVFSDADKNWYKNYLIAVLPKLEVSGCYTTHNISSGRRGRSRGSSSSYLDYLYSLPNLETTVDSRGGGLAISYKKTDDAAAVRFSAKGTEGIDGISSLILL